MKKHTIKIQKTARYFTLGEAGARTKHAWFLCHGYAQLGNYFLPHFEALNDGTSLLVAPEGLHRFYAQGFSGRVGASWMTKEDRLDDIRDYVHALDAICEEVLRDLPQDVRVHVLGFSQGSATVSRWMATGKSRADTLTLWCGFFPPDLDWNAGRERLKNRRTFIVTASQDEFISPEQEKEQLENFRAQGISFEHLRFEGKHTIDQETLLKLRARVCGE